MALILIEEIAFAGAKWNRIHVSDRKKVCDKSFVAVLVTICLLTIKITKEAYLNFAYLYP